MENLTLDWDNDGKGLFFTFATSQTLYWILTLVALFAVQWWCEWRFTRLEH